MLVLAFDASTGVVTTAVARVKDEGREVLAEVSVHARGASEVLLPAVHAVLGLAGTSLDEVGRILVGVGPGTFTGIRIAAAAARSLSLATGVPLARNSSLAALAAPALTTAPNVLAVLDARRRQVFAQRFGEDGALGEILCAAPGDLCVEGSPQPPLVVGDGAIRYREALSAVGRVPPDASLLHQVTAAGHVLSADLSPVPAEEIIPIYVREPDAEVRRDLNPWSRP